MAENMPVPSNILEQADKLPKWFRDTVSMGVEALLINPGMERAPRGSAVDDTIALFQIGLWAKALNEGEAWDEAQDQWRLAEVFVRVLTHSNRFPTLKALLYQMPARGENKPVPDPIEHARAVLERREAEVQAAQAEAPRALPAPEGPKPIDRSESARKTSSRRFRELREILNSKAERVNARGREGVA